MGAPGGARVRLVARGLGALLLLVLLLVGMPALLIGVVGLPTSLPSATGLLHRLTTPDDGTVFVAAASTVGWLGWAVFAVSTGVEAAALLRRGPARRVPALAGPQRLAAHLLAAVAILGSSAPLGSAPAVARPAAVALRWDRPPPALRLHLPAPAPGGAVPPAARAAVAPAAAPGPRGVEVEVHRGDTLWGLAERYLGEGEAWPRIARANYGRRQPDGRTLTDAHWIYPGWRLVLPAATGAGPLGHNGAPTPPPRTAPRAAAGRHADGQWSSRDRDGRGQPLPDLGGPTAPAPAQPSATPAPSGGRNREPAAARASAEPVLVAFAGGGVLLAGVTWTALRRSRRRQLRHRRPGRAIATAPPELAATEQAVLDAGRRGGADVAWLNAALRALVRTLAASDVQLPDVAAAAVSERSIQLVLAGPHHLPPPPWRAEPDGTRWTLDRGEKLEFTAADAAFSFAPYPTLVTVGSGPNGEHWLLDLEQIATLSLTGDEDRCLDLARFLAAELAHNPWSEHLVVTLVGFGAEMAALNLGRLRATDDLTTALAALRHQLERAHRLIEDTGVGVLEGRRRGDVGEGWPPHLLLVAPALAAAAGPALSELVAAIGERAGRSAVALVLAGGAELAAAAARWRLHLDRAGVLRIPALGLELTAQQLPAAEAGDLAALLALAADVTDEAMPPAPGDQPWDAYADAAGAPLPQLTMSRPGPDLEGAGAAETAAPAESVLPLPTEAYLAVAATTAADVAALAPAVPAGARSTIEGADPGLDADLRAWHDRAARVPKLRLLGPVSLTAWGQPPGKRLPYYTELVAYLATRPRGASREEIGTALHPHDPQIVEKTTVQAAMSVLRGWLGVDPRTGCDHLSDARYGRGVYRVEGLLCDAELFRRLRLRGTARGAAGTADLQAALDLVTGEPFAELRHGGYAWLIDAPGGERLDVVYLAMTVDLAHTLATGYLGSDQPERAIAAAERALAAGASDDVALLDLVVAHTATGNPAQAELYVARILANHDAEVEEDLPPRTYDVLRRRHLLGGPSGGSVPGDRRSAARG